MQFHAAVEQCTPIDMVVLYRMPAVVERFLQLFCWCALKEKSAKIACRSAGAEMRQEMQTEVAILLCRLFMQNGKCRIASALLLPQNSMRNCGIKHAAIFLQNLLQQND